MPLTAGTLRGPHGHLLARRCVQVVWLLMALLIGANIVLAAIRFGFDIEPTGMFAVAYYRLHLTSEANVAAWYSGLLMFTCAAVVAAIALAEWRFVNRWWPHWAVMSAVFVLLSMDEVISLHERLSEHVHALIGVSTGLWTNAWVMIGSHW